MKKPIFKIIAPATQTEYKLHGSGKRSVKTLLKQEKKIVARLGDAQAVCAIANGTVGFAVPEAGAIAAISGGGCYLLGKCGEKKISKYKSLLKSKKKVRFKYKIYFKWTNPKQYKYTFKIKSWYQYKTSSGKWKRCSSVHTGYTSGQATADRWK